MGHLGRLDFKTLEFKLHISRKVDYPIDAIPPIVATETTIQLPGYG
jgi:hypothetical protein